MHHRQYLPSPISRRTLSRNLLIAVALGCSGCSTPIGVTRVTPEESYQIASRNPLTNAELSNDAKAVLHRYNLGDVYESDPWQAIMQLHRIALKDDRRDVLYALAELSYAQGEQVSSSRTEQPAQRDLFLQSAIYAFLYLLGDGAEPAPTPYDHRFRETCELYNRALARAFASGDDGRAEFIGRARTVAGKSLPVLIDNSRLGWKTSDFESFLPADAFDVHGFSIRNRTPGMGAPLIGVMKNTEEAPNGGALPLTAFLLLEGGLRDLEAGRAKARLELYSAYDDHAVNFKGKEVPLQSDTTAPLAYRLNDPEIWNLGLKRFLFGEDIKHHVLFVQPYQPGRIPVVLVHGTGSSPVWWAEMVNMLRSDPTIRKRYQFWFYQYTSNLMLAASGADLRDALTGMVTRLDPAGQDPAMRQMIVIGHSQGGLLTHMTAVKTGDELWRSVSDKPVAALDASPEIKQKIERSMFFEPLPFVKRIVFIATPHRGSFLTKSWVRRLARNFVTLPTTLIQGGADGIARLTGQLKVPDEIRDKVPTSVDGMAEHNPVLETLLRLPLGPDIKAHSIIAVLPGEAIPTGNDGVVEYRSAHLDKVESELVVRSGHSCQGHPATIEEVRRIMIEHLGHPASGDLSVNAAALPVDTGRR
ncbi:esterase/lipase family protein [Methylolobus aquaticus]